MRQTKALTPRWEYVADTVMGGVSRGTLTRADIEGRTAALLRGDVSLDNNGGFVQMAFDLRADGAAFDASTWDGITFAVWGNGETYDIRLRTDQLRRPWQSFRTAFTTTDTWHEIDVPFASFMAHRTEARFDPSLLRRIGILAIGRVFRAEVAIADIQLYRG